MSWLAIHWEDDQEGLAMQVARPAEALLRRFRVRATAAAAAGLRAIGLEDVEEVVRLGGLIEPDGDEAPAAVLLFAPGAIGRGGAIDAFVAECVGRDLRVALNPATAAAVFETLRLRRRATLIFNPISGSGDPEQELTRIRTLLEPAMTLDVLQTTEQHRGDDRAREALESGPDLVIAAGGDGTVSEAANVLSGTGVPLAIIPRGTANALAMALFGAQTYLDPIGSACETILDGVPRRIDTVRCGEHQMLQLAGIGVESGMIERAQRDLKARYGVLAYLVGGWEQIRAQEEFEVELQCDGKRHRFRTGSVVVANAAPPSSVLAQGAGAPVFDDGLIDVTTIVDVKTPWDAVMTMLELFQAGLTQRTPSERVISMRASRVRIEADPPQRIALDGELLGMTPVEFEVWPASLTVLMPRADAPGRQA